MATSGTYNFTVTRDDIIRDAMLNVGKLDPDDSPDPSETSDCARKLQMIVKQWQGKSDYAPGLKTWSRRRGNLFLSSSTGQYLVGPGATGWTTDKFIVTTTSASAVLGAGSIVVTSPTGIVIGSFIGINLSSGDLFWTTVTNVVGSTVSLTSNLPSAVNSGGTVYAYQVAAQQPQNVEAAVLRDKFNEDIPMKIMLQEEYDILPSKTDPVNISDPTAIYYEFQLGNSNLFIDVAGVIDVTKYLVITYLEPIQDITNPLDNPEFPVEYYNSLCWELSKQIAPMFRAVWTPEMESNYKTALALGKNKDPQLSRQFFNPGSED